MNWTVIGYTLEAIFVIVCLVVLFLFLWKNEDQAAGEQSHYTLMQKRRSKDGKKD